MTNVLSCETVSGTKPFNVVCIIAERVYLVRCQAEPFYIWFTFCHGTPTAGLLLFLLRLSSAAADAGGLLLTREPFHLVLRAGVVGKVAELSAKLFCLRAKGSNGVLSVFPELRICVPGGHVEGEVQDDLVMRFRKQSLKDRYPALETASATLSDASLETGPT